jgi:hypothetical protein
LARTRRVIGLCSVRETRKSLLACLLASLRSFPSLRFELVFRHQGEEALTYCWLGGVEQVSKGLRTFSSVVGKVQKR